MKLSTPSAVFAAVLPVLAGVSLLALAGLAGCDNGSTRGKISSSQFVSVQKANNGLRNLTDELDLRIAASIPDTLAGSSVRVIEEIENDRLLVFISAGNAVTSVDLCPDCNETGATSSVDLHYSREGIEEELGRRLPGVVGPLVQISNQVEPVRLPNGWILAYETSTESLLGFRYDPTFRPATGGVSSRNNGRGNGLLLSVVLRKQDIALQLRGDSESTVPQISRLHGLPNGDVLVMFQSAASQLEDVYRLGFSTESVELNRDFDDLSGQSLANFDLLRGVFVAPNPVFVSKEAIRVAANPNVVPGVATDVVADQFQPVTLPSDGSVLLYDASSSAFVRVFQSGGVGQAERIVTPGELLQLTQNPPPYSMGTSWFHPSEPELYVVEESNDVAIAINYETFESRVAISNQNLTSGRRDPRVQPGTIVPGAGEPPILQVSENDIRENRLVFDMARDELVSVNYDTGLAVIVLKQIDYFEVTGNTIANYAFVKSYGEAADGSENLRVWDSATFSLYELRLLYNTLPVVQDVKPGS